MPAKDLLDAARRWWPLLVVAAVLGGLLGHVVPDRAADQYRSDVRLLVGPLSGGTDTLRASGLLAQTYAAVLSTDEVLRQAARAGGVPDATPMDEVRKLVAITSNDKTRMLTLEITLEEPGLARAMGESLTQQLLLRVARDEAQQRQLREQLLASTGPEAVAALGPVGVEGRVTVVDPARTPARAVPKPVALFTVLGALVAAAVTLGLLLLLGTRSRRGALPGLTDIVHRRLLGSCRLDSGGPLRQTRRAVVARRPSSADALDYRLIAAKAELLAPTRPLQSLAVFGASHSTGSGEVAANLALTFAQGGRTVAVLDLAPHGSVVDRLALLDGEREVQRIGDFVVEMRVTPVGKGRVAVVLSHEPALRTTPQDSPAVADLLREVADLVVLHAPPLLLEPTTAVVAAQVDGVAVVAAEVEGEAALGGVADAMDALERIGAPVLGAVLALGRPVNAGQRTDWTGAPQRRHRVSTSAVARRSDEHA